MDAVEVFGAVAVAAMVVFYALEQRSPAFVLAFALACLASSGYALLIGSWPFAVAEFVWAGVAVSRWWQARRALGLDFKPT